MAQVGSSIESQRPVTANFSLLFGFAEQGCLTVPPDKTDDQVTGEIHLFLES